MSDLQICARCLYRFPSTVTLEVCPMCADDRGALSRRGQKWITEAMLQYAIETEEIRPWLHALEPNPPIPPGNRALLVNSDSRNILWDCPAYIDDVAIESICDLGGVDAIALSHPHFYGAMVDWSNAFGGVPIYVHELDREWVFRTSDAIQFWKGEHIKLADNIDIVHVGGHYKGACVLHVQCEGGALLTADVLSVTPDRHITVMHSFPNQIPLSLDIVSNISERCDRLDFDAIYGGWRHRDIREGAKAVVQTSLDRYCAALQRVLVD